MASRAKTWKNMRRRGCAGLWRTGSKGLGAGNLGETLESGIADRIRVPREGKLWRWFGIQVHSALCTVMVWRFHVDSH